MSKERLIRSIYYYRNLGIEYCKTDGSKHYKRNGIEPAEYAIANGRFENFAVVNINKYAERFTVTRDPEDLKKVVDYGHILVGIELDKPKEEVIEDDMGDR